MGVNRRKRLQQKNVPRTHLVLLREAQAHEQRLFVFRPRHVLAQGGVKMVEVPFSALFRDTARDVAGEVGPLER